MFITLSDKSNSLCNFETVKTNDPAIKELKATIEEREQAIELLMKRLKELINKSAAKRMKESCT
jgi:uncharacterized coiled-coil protein SlyX